jgi:3-oxoacyl-[acyl-carrier protein] reductase
VTVVEELAESLGLEKAEVAPPMIHPEPMECSTVVAETTGSRHLTGKTAWVTGSSRGIGRVIASHLASCGASVAIHGTSPYSPRFFDEGDSLQEVAAAIAGEYCVDVLPVHGDLTDPEEVGRIAAEIRDRFGQIDVVVNNAGGDIGSAGQDGANAGKPQNNDAVFISVEDARTVLDRNLMTCILVCREVAPEMMERRSGRIVNIGSIAGGIGLAPPAIYSTAKAAVHEYSRCLAVQLRPYNVAVNVVAPGDTVTPRFVASRTIDENMLVEGGTLERYGRPIEVARAVEFLVSDSTTYITGQVLRVDGGKHCFAI